MFDIRQICEYLFIEQSKGGILVSPMAELVGPRLYSCYNCRNHVALHDDVISKAFQVKIMLFYLCTSISWIVLRILIWVCVIFVSLNLNTMFHRWV